MLINDDYIQLDSSELFRNNAFANIKMAQRLCKEMNYKKNALQVDIYNVNIIMTLMYHSVELFFKFAILKKGGRKENHHHHIRTLKENYENLSSKEEYFKIDVPFITNYIGFSKGEEAILIKKENKNEGEQIYRYPTDKNGQIWKDIMGFCPKESFQLCNDLIQEFKRIEFLINKKHP